MSVSNYTPNSDICGYNYSKLKDVVYLVSSSHIKNVHIDDGYAYIDGLTELPMRLSGFSISLSEESSLDERYKFTKTVSFSMHGYIPSTSFDDKYYVILESVDGTFWMVNIDFPSKVSYTFTLSSQLNQTDFRFTSQSNFPTLMMIEGFTSSVQQECVGYNVNGIESLKLIEREYSSFDEKTKTLYTYGKNYQDVEFLKDSLTFTEDFNGEVATSTIEFRIGFDAYKSSWHYNLLEFLQNLYTAVIDPKNGDNRYFAGFNFGLQPSFSINAESENANDIITVRLVEMSNHGSSAAVDWSEKPSTDTKWVYIKSERQYVTYECMGDGLAKYLVQKEFNANGYPTGRYKVMQGYQEQFAGIGDIVETFTNVETFYEPSCSSQQCYITSDIPNTISFTSVTCNTYSLISTCSWSISDVPSFATVSPMTGNANQQYTISVCNTASTFDGRSGTFTINSGTNKRNVTLVLNPPSNILTPTAATINCLSQNVTFTYNSACAIRVTSIDDALSYQLTNSSLIVTTPRNDSTANTRTYSITVTDCNGKTQTVVITQDKTYERWVNTTGYLCVDDDSFTRQLRYTGTTASDINTPTGEYRPGTLIQEGDERCSTITTKWVFDHKYYCIDGQKTECWEQYIRYGQGEWQKTGVTKLGSAVEDVDGFCDQEAIYSWRQSIKWQCGA